MTDLSRFLTFHASDAATCSLGPQFGAILSYTRGVSELTQAQAAEVGNGFSAETDGDAFSRISFSFVRSSI